MEALNYLKRQLLLTHVYGIPVKIDYRWFFVFVLMVWLTWTNIPRSMVENQYISLLLSTITTIAFFLSIFGHELAHAVAARMEGIEIREIILHPFGGLARLRHEPDSPRAEFRIALAGPSASFLFSLLFLAAYFFSNAVLMETTAKLFFLLFFWNLLLAIFNLFPGYPLDGGRVLRAFLWYRGYDLNEATRLTGRCGQLISVALIGFGLFIAFVRSDLFTGLWTVLVGLFLLDAATAIVKQVDNYERLTVSDVMTAPIMVEPETTVGRFVNTTLPLFRQTTFLVAQQKQLHGILALEDLKKLPRNKWHDTAVKEVMRPVNQDFFVELSTPLIEAREIMRENGIGALAVLDTKGAIVGFLQRGKIRRTQK
jgi:Zn-dependent protease